MNIYINTTTKKQRTKTDSPTIHWIVDMITHKINKPKTNPVIKQNPRSIEKEKTTIRM